MIKTFQTDRNTLFFPTRWANSVARWILGLISKEGTIKITNTPNPSDDGACSIDVNMDAVYEEIKRRLAEDAKRKNDDDETIDQDIKDENDGSQSGGGGNGKYGVRFGFADVMDNVVPTTIKWMAFGKEEDLDTYTGDITWNGYTLGVFSCNTAENNYPVKVVPGDLITGGMSARPVYTIENGSPGEIYGIEFGKMRDLILREQGLMFARLCKSGVRPTFNGNGVLTKLEFGSEEDFTYNVAAKIKTVETQIGCPFNS